MTYHPILFHHKADGGTLITSLICQLDLVTKNDNAPKRNDAN